MHAGEWPGSLTVHLRPAGAAREPAVVLARLGVDLVVPHESTLRRVLQAVAPTSGIHVRLLIMDFRGVGTRKGAPDLGECGLL